MIGNHLIVTGGDNSYEGNKTPIDQYMKLQTNTAPPIDKMAS